MRIECNERGFNPKNVDAICRVRASTKRRADSGVHFIGEKGIGFKSVFQAASTVWISSRHYSFKFDTSRRLGMIAPIWDRPPTATKPGVTTFILLLHETYDIGALRRELKRLDSRLLIFLRQLQQIVVTIVENDGTKSTRILTRADRQSEIGSIIRLTENCQILDYIVIPHVIADLPEAEKRAGITRSTILLAFPLDQERQPLITNQRVYAFLPIRDFGLKVSYPPWTARGCDVHLASFSFTPTFCLQRVVGISIPRHLGIRDYWRAALMPSPMRSNI
jgi:hypothetical protein